MTEPTCTEQGYTTYTCANCGHTYQDGFTDALGHDFDDSIEENVTIIPATTIATGSKTVKCSRCDVLHTDILPRLPDDENKPIFIASDGVAHPGYTVRVKVSIANNSGIIATILHLNYDPSILTLVDVANNNLFGSGSFTPGNDLSAIPYNIVYEDSLSTTNHTENGSFITLTFRVKEDAPLGSTTVSVSYDEDSTYDKDLHLVEFAVQNGMLQITAREAGDSNGDGVLNTKDATIIRRYLAGWDGIDLDESAADVNDDGRVSLIDVTLILRYLAGWDDVELQ